MNSTSTILLTLALITLTGCGAPPSERDMIIIRQQAEAEACKRNKEWLHNSNSKREEFRREDMRRHSGSTFSGIRDRTVMP